MQAEEPVDEPVTKLRRDSSDIQYDAAGLKIARRDSKVDPQPDTTGLKVTRHDSKGYPPADVYTKGRESKWDKLKDLQASKSKNIVWTEAVRRSVFLSALQKPELKFVQGSARLISVEKGQVIYEAGSEPEFMYIVHSGLVRATQGSPAMKEARRMREFGPSDSFGSCELLYPNAKRMSTLTAVEPGLIWTIARLSDPSLMYRALLWNKTHFPRRELLPGAGVFLT